jgi:hypothetical protein
VLFQISLFEHRIEMFRSTLTKTIILLLIEFKFKHNLL